MIEGYLKVIITSLVSWTIFFVTSYVGFVDTTTPTNIYLFLVVASFNKLIDHINVVNFVN